MNKTIFDSQSAANLLEQAFTDILKTVVIEETALSNLLDFENDLIQQAKKNAANLEEFVTLNESIDSVIRNITRMKRMTQIKLQNMKKLIETVENRNDSEPG